MDRRNFLKITASSCAMVALGGCFENLTSSSGLDKKLPNIVYILCDDLGYGDVSCLNDQSKIQTRNIDSIAENGMIFTDAHSGSAVCTPTRYGILTGRYCWRSRLKKSVLNGYSDHLIEPERMTVASMLKQSGYSTACIGKWHLGWDWAMKGSKPEEVDFSKPVKNGPDANGFDYYYCHCGSLDMPPYVYVENGRVTGQPNRITSGEGYGFWRKGPTGSDFCHIDVLDNFTNRAAKYITKHSLNKKPFFLYLALPAPHTPILPSKDFQGKSGLNPYGDFVMQVDASVGRILKSIQDSGIKDNTLVIFSSDNGCSPAANFEKLQEMGHDPSYIFRGYKADIFEGGHRIPFIASWLAKIRKGSTCNDTICLTDLMATCAAITSRKLADDAGQDSVNILPDLLGTAKGPLREATVHHSINGSFSIRQGKWKLELCPGSGGWSKPRPNSKEAMRLPKIQLYDLSNDIGERINVQDKHPDVVKRLTGLLQKYADLGRSTPGKPDSNQGNVDIHMGQITK